MATMSDWVEKFNQLKAEALADGFRFEVDHDRDRDELTYGLDIVDTSTFPPEWETVLSETIVVY